MRRTVGVEEEFLLVARASPATAGDGEVVAADASAGSDGQFEHELKREQVELATEPHQSMRPLADELVLRRRELAEAASRRGVRLAALATHPLPGDATTTEDERYARMTERFGPVANVQLTCGMHVHVAIDSSDEGVAVIDRLRPWLAVLVALSANSPFVDGADTGYASFRTMMWSQWPTSLPPEPFGDVTTYERVRADLVTTGAALDEGMIYFPARLSARYPTVELRVADVCPSAPDAVTIAALVRALVTWAADAWRAGAPADRTRTEVLAAATWRAARFGVGDRLVAPAGAELLPAWDVVGSLVRLVADALDASGDRDLVETGLSEIRRRGTGADLQRRVARASGLAAVVDHVCALTTAD